MGVAEEEPGYCVRVGYGTAGAGVTSRRSLSSTFGAGACKANSMAMHFVQLGVDMCPAAVVCTCVRTYLVEITA
jgi:hypothetical protein